MPVPSADRRPNNNTDYVSKKMSIRRYLFSFQGKYDAHYLRPEDFKNAPIKYFRDM